MQWNLCDFHFINNKILFLFLNIWQKDNFRIKTHCQIKLLINDVEVRWISLHRKSTALYIPEKSLQFWLPSMDQRIVFSQEHIKTSYIERNMRNLISGFGIQDNSFSLVLSSNCFVWVIRFSSGILSCWQVTKSSFPMLSGFEDDVQL